MSTFQIGAASATFTVTEGGFSDKGGALLEEWQATIIVDDDAAWGALFALQTPKELVSVRACRGVPGTPPTVSIDVGGGAGVGLLTLDDYDAHQALLIDLSSDAPVTANGQRLCKAVWQIVG